MRKHKQIQERNQRLKKAARLSKTKTPAEICEALNISDATLRRYAGDPRWQGFGGVDLPRYFKTGGRPVNDPDTEAKLIAEAYQMHNDGEKWVDIASRLGLSIRQLEYLRKKYPQN